MIDGASPLAAALLVLAALGAGFLDAVVGGGGLVQLPALVVAFPQLAPIHILATNKLSSICGTSTSSLTYYRRACPDLRTAVPLAAVAFLGAIGGALTASALPRSVFDPLILVVLLAVGAYTVLRPQLGAHERLRFVGRRHTWLAALIGLAIGFYDGALGPGTGSFLVVSLVALLGYAFLQASAKAKIANFATNLGALVVFVPQGAVLWRIGLLMGLANLVGGYAGARTAVARGAGFIRVVLLLVVTAFVVKIGYDVLSAR